MEVSVPSYFQHLAMLLTDAKIAEIFTSGSWKNVTNRAVYEYHVNLLESPKIELDFGASMSRAWKRLHLPFLFAEIRELFFLLLHNRLPVKERLFRIGMTTEPFCDYCLAVKSINSICDMEHFFCQCLRVIEAWRGVKEIACNLLQVNLRDSDLTTLLFPGHTFDAEVMWLLGSYVHYMDFYSCKTSHFYQSSAFWSSEVQIQK